MKIGLVLAAYLIIGGLCQQNPTQDEEGSFRLPLASYRIWQPFANRNSLFDWKYHCAEDAYGDGGTAVYAIADGVVSFSGPVGGYGWLIIIDHPEYRIYSLYGHVSTRREKATSGEVRKGELIAYLADDDEDGSGGEYPDWGPHLHFGLRQGFRADYHDSGDSRWMAGYTTIHPAELGWLAPTFYIAEHESK